jgi:3-oxoacyl-[acyl-carrier-protein] synthase III
MNTKISAYSVVYDESKNKLIPLLTQAANKCLENAGIFFSDVDIIINSSIYSEDYISEPSVASLVQNMLNEGKPSVNQFSFDLNSGGGGVIQAMQVIDTMIKSGRIKNGLIVAGDTKPVKGNSGNFKINNGAGAILLSATVTQSGFSNFKTYTYEEYIEMSNRFLSWENNRVVLNNNIDSAYSEKCIELAIGSIKKSGIQVCTDKMELICPDFPEKFRLEITNHLGFNNIKQNKHPLYSAGILQSLSLVNSRKDFLFINTGPGITVSLALYKHQL